MKNALIVLWSAALLTAAAGAQVPAPAAQGALRGARFSVSDNDLYCAFFAAAELPALTISGGDGTRTLFSDGDRVVLSGPGVESLAPGQVLSVLELGDKIPSLSKKPSPGRIVYQRGRIQVLSVEGSVVTARVERSCGPIRTGHRLVPFLERVKLTAVDPGLDPAGLPAGAPTGRVLHLEDGAVQIATDLRALIDLGRNDGLAPGRLVTIYAPPDPGQPLTASANAVVIDAGPTSSTVKILTAKMPVRLGDLVKVR